MNKLMKFLIAVPVLTMLFAGCSKDDDNNEDTFNDPGFTSIATDAGGDANSGLDATRLGFAYDQVADKVKLKIYTNNLSSFSGSPSADFSFKLPNGTTNSDPTGEHWTAPGVAVHLTAEVYCDSGGTAPSTYTYTQQYAANRIYLASDTNQVARCSNCVVVEADVANNWIIYTFNRTDIISDAEMGGNSATIKVVANAGHNIGWDDNITLGADFTITK